MSSGFIAIILITQGKVLVGSFVAILQSVQRIQGTLNNVTNSLSSIYESSFLIQEFREFLTLREVDFKTKEKIEKVNVDFKTKEKIEKVN
ncbi:ABC transporter ATP-binding protein, partial [Ralstonia pickettii]|nr:ABC transporter ATP-binding protein [Ralstonia pickettii]